MHFHTAFLALSTAAIASAMSITKPDSSGWQNGTVTIAWTSAAGDPEVFSVELRDTNTPSVISPLAVANNVNTALGTYSFLLPPVPDAATYQIEFVNVTNINQVYASSTTFAIRNVAQAATSSAGTAGTITSASTRTGSSTSSTSTAPASTSSSTNSALGLEAPVLAVGVLAGLAAFL
ncbi:hypothetical protein CTheo_6053 [Ceratobasidium theobromae]|uniref:Yeast cell wall synthesis Kre9/Knh1-like N-terminal domain-containing protein n=1 Tax=Ceratobasidium theobromae TaxID=1582974 RepID=A0A5N5QFR3_9AGAM|nr:hypothetical protein CTheo_6053 [Ceratobasidium theobromae]